MEGKVLCEGSRRRWESSKARDRSCVACFPSSNLLPWKPASQPQDSRPCFSRINVHRPREHFMSAHLAAPHPGPLPDTLLASLLAHRTAQQQGPCGLPRWQIRPPESQGIFCVCQRHSKTSQGIPLMVQRLGHSAFTAMAQVQPLVGELRSHKPQCGHPLKKKQSSPTLTIQPEPWTFILADFKHKFNTNLNHLSITGLQRAEEGQELSRFTNSYFSPRS